MPDEEGKETEAEWATRMIRDWDITEPMYWTRKKKHDPFVDARKKEDREMPTRMVMPDENGKETEAEWATRMIRDWDITEPMYWTRKKKHDPFDDEKEKG